MGGVAGEGTPFGRYQLIELLGRGGMGEVWRAHDPVIGRFVALKVLPANYADDAVSKERFRREARAAAGLDELHVVPIYDFGEVDGRLFVTMKLIAGSDLQQLVGDGPLSPDRAVSIIEQVASALQAAHEVGLVHRDVKPSNVFVTKDDFAYLIDFGIARAAGESGLTSTGTTIGTWAYMAPECFENGVASARADIYALTCVLYQLLIGEPPFPGGTLAQVAVSHMMHPPPRPSELAAGVPAAMDEVIATGMAKDPEQRYATTKDLARAARSALTKPARHRSTSAAAADLAKDKQPSVDLPTGGGITTDQSSRTSRDERATPLTDAAATKADDAVEPPTPDVAAAAPRRSAIETATEAAPLVNVGSAPTQQGPVSPASASTVQSHTGSTVEPPSSRRTTWRSPIALGAVAFLVIAAIVAVIMIGTQSHSGGGSAAPSSSPRSSPTPTQSTPAPSSSEAKLLGLVSSSDNCKPDSPEGNGDVAEVRCHPDAPQVAVLVYQLFPDQATLSKAFIGLNSSSAASKPVSCADGGEIPPQNWAQGKVKCTITFGSPYVMWSIDSQLVLGYAAGQSGVGIGELYRWWTARSQR